MARARAHVARACRDSADPRPYTLNALGVTLRTTEDEVQRVKKLTEECVRVDVHFGDPETHECEYDEQAYMWRQRPETPAQQYLPDARNVIGYQLSRGCLRTITLAKT